MKDIITSILSKLAYYSVLIIVLCVGSTLLISQAIPDTISDINVVEKISYLSLTYIPDKFAIIVGFLLIVMFRLLRHKSKKIYKYTILIILIWGIVSIFKGLDFFSILYIVIIGLLLYVGKNQFYRNSFAVGWGMAIKDISILFLFLLMYIYTYYLSISGKITKIAINDYELQISNTSTEIIYLGVIGFLISILVLFMIYYINTKNKFLNKSLAEYEDDVKEILIKFGGSSISHFVYLNDKYVYLNNDKDVFIQYQTYANKIFILGNPVGNKDKIFDVIQEFYTLSDMYGYTCVFCAIDSKLLPYLHETGYEFFKLGEEATVNLNTFTLEGRKMKSVRNAISRVSKEGYTFHMMHPPFDDNFFEEIKAVSDEWLNGREEKGFSIGFFDEEYLNQEPICIVRDNENNIKGFANIMPMYDNKTLSIDLMRFSNKSCNGIMDFMFVNLFEYGKNNGYKRFNMGMVPLSNVGRSRYAFLSEKIAAQVYIHGHRFYSFKGLKKFKEKYCESWDSRYMAYKRKTSLVTTMMQVMLLVSKPYNKIK